MQSNKQGQREEGRDWRSCYSCSAAPSRTTFAVSLKGQSQSSSSSTHSLVSPTGSSYPNPSLNFTGPELNNSQTLKFPRVAAILKLIQVQDRWLGRETRVTISAHTWFEKQRCWKGRFPESLPLQHLQLSTTKLSELATIYCLPQ